MSESTKSLKPSDAIILLKKEGCDERLILHAITVSRLAKKIAEKIESNGYEIDVDFIEVAALLHDLGRSRTHGISHGIEGAAILRKLNMDRYARVCETHIAAGLTREEAKSLGLPEKDYMPQTIEEKVVAHADNLTCGSDVVPIEQTIKRLKETLGCSHPSIKRIKTLNEFITALY